MNTKVSITKTIIFPFLTFITMFLGAGFISGAIVHLGEGVNPWDVSILFIGVALFIIGHYIQEFIYNKKDLKEAGTVKFIFFSLLLSLGIGMASGGIQHFVDTPKYSANLIPIGLFLGAIAYTLKNNIALAKSQWRVLTLSTLLFSIVSWGVLTITAANMSTSSSHSHGAENQQAMQDQERG
ncbi:MAG: hypothetical protein AAB551_02975 [Patescibacteria group bacterium]|mgnify:CR=1 FL=1